MHTVPYCTSVPRSLATLRSEAWLRLDSPSSCPLLSRALPRIFLQISFRSNLRSPLSAHGISIRALVSSLCYRVEEEGKGGTSSSRQGGMPLLLQRVREIARPQSEPPQTTQERLGQGVPDLGPLIHPFGTSLVAPLGSLADSGTDLELRMVRDLQKTRIRRRRRNATR